MFESAEIGHRISKDEFRKAAPALRESLLELQYELKERGHFPVVILINGVDGAGKGETVNLLNSWMDPRLIDTHAFSRPNEDEKQKPRMWRYWQSLPPKGRIGILFGSWYTDPIDNYVRDNQDDEHLAAHINEIVRFEKLLVHEGALILKFWFHLSKDQQKNRLKELEKNPLTRWRVSDHDWENFKLYNEYRKVSERVLRQTSSFEAPWVVVEGEDEAYRSMTVAQQILYRVKEHLSKSQITEQRIEAPPILPPIDNLHILDTLSLDQIMDKKTYEVELEKWQGKLNLLTRHPNFKHHAIAMVFEGNDAAGKGGSIRRVTAALDARQYRIIPIAAPSEDERRQPWLWRFWKHVPKHGDITIFDRSWYGRVLVERVEGFCSEADWMRAYEEINDFEGQLLDDGVIMVKFWLTISKDEQLKRFKSRENLGYKRFKITDEDWRNREKWQNYQIAVCDMIDRTSTDVAPWTLVEANNKYFARIKIIKTIVERVSKALGCKLDD